MKSTADSGPKPTLEELKAQLRESKQMEIRVVTGSMEPVIRTGEELTLEEIQEPLKLFDIIVYWNGSQYICHYVWAINRNPNSKGERWVVTRSLVSRLEDFPVLESNILGRVADRKIPFLRKLWIVFRKRFLR